MAITKVCIEPHCGFHVSRGAQKKGLIHCSQHRKWIDEEKRRYRFEKAQTVKELKAWMKKYVPAVKRMGL